MTKATSPDTKKCVLHGRSQACGNREGSASCSLGLWMMNGLWCAVAYLLLEVGGAEGGEGGRRGEGGGVGWQGRGVEELQHAGHKQVLLLPTQSAASQGQGQAQAGRVARQSSAQRWCGSKVMG